MGIIRPATPGFLITLIATALLAVVSFCVPYFKSVYFLKANISVSGVNGSITFGTLGYCLELANGTTCSKPSVGYQLDINGLVGNKLPIEIPQVAVKWLTSALVLHIVALALAAGSAVFGLLAHVREMSMACCSTCVSGFAAAVALIAFIFDLILFFVAKSRINAVGSAEMGNAIWLTLAAWVLLFFSGCFYTIGRCCISKRGRGRSGGFWKGKDDRDSEEPYNKYSDQMRLDAVKAEADRKARQKAGEGGLPAFYETQPLSGQVHGDNVYLDDLYKDTGTPTASTLSSTGRNQYAGGGYVQGAPGSTAVDEYYSPTHNQGQTYPPQPPHSRPQRQLSNGTYATSTTAYNQPDTSYAAALQLPQRQGSGYAPATYSQPSYGYGAPTSSSPAPINAAATPPQQYSANNLAVGAGYGHAAGGSSYHSAVSHNQYPSAYSQYDPPNSQYSEPAFNADTYNNTSVMMNPPMPVASSTFSSHPNPYLSSSPPLQQHSPVGDGYGSNHVTPLTESSPYALYSNQRQAVNGNTEYAPYAQTETPHPHDEQPPGYESGTSGVTGAWGKH